jgi:hypothetical protein
MQIETYEIEESKDEMARLGADSESIDLIEKLGLHGQKGLSNGEKAERLPYRKMTEEEGNIYGLLFPKKTPIEDYSDSIIPLRVLQVAAHAKELNFCESLRVWHPENADIEGPILVGSRKHPENSHITEIFVLARWGEALETLEALAVRAKKIWINHERIKAMDAKDKLERDVEALNRFEKSNVIPVFKKEIYYSGF